MKYIHHKIKRQKFITLVMGACIAAVIVFHVWNDISRLSEILPDFIKQNFSH